ncbi:MAG: hypothetical protein NC203_06160 [Firmicutes bacterium]|nr:hypothetical protein [Bacillota bacterium]
MFHIKKDKRSQKSAEMIVYGVKQCLKNKKFEDITITDIQKASSVGRATFYRLFDRTDDVLAFSCDIWFRKVLNEVRQHNCPTIRDLYKCGLENADFMELVAASRRADILYNCISRYEKEIKIILKFKDEDNFSSYFVPVLTGIMISILFAWINNGRKESGTDLYKIIGPLLKQLSDTYDLDNNKQPLTTVQ